MILLVTAAGPRAYVNLCPHYTMPLDAGTGLFLSADGDIQCRQHFALFAPADGRCFAGACPGASLDAIPLQVDGRGNIHIAD
nr:Rieske 2Fe-2S domain-containing protein [Novosphingobium sp. SG751A]